MRFACLCLGGFLALSVVHAQSIGTTAPPQDPQAVAILNQVVTANGGTQAIGAVTDYTATGNITFTATQQIQGTVTIQGLIIGSEFRIDAILPAGTRSWVVDQGIVS